MYNVPSLHLFLFLWKNVFTPLVSLLSMECKLHSGNLSPEHWYAKLKQDSDTSHMQSALKARAAAVPKGAH